MKLKEFELFNKITTKTLITESARLTMYKVDVNNETRIIVEYFDTIVYNQPINNSDLQELFDGFYVMELEAELYYKKKLLNELNKIKDVVENIKK